MTDNRASTHIEHLWEQLLSRDGGTVLQAYSSLAAHEQSIVLTHLHRMAEEPGWHPEQRASAQAALSAITQKLLDNSSNE